MNTIVFTGGGSGGHVMPALTIIKELNNDDIFDIHYIGGINSIERDLVKDYKLSYHPIHTGKLRRYLSLENIKDIFKIIFGLFESLFILFKLKNKKILVFSTGGFVSVPVVVAAKCLSIPIFIHEQTSRVGLANKICSKLAKKVFISFEESFKFFDRSKTIYSGYPLRAECFSEDVNSVVINGQNLNQQSLPILFITGGGNGSKLLNDIIKKNLDYLTTRYIVVHQVGKAFISEFEKIKNPHYFPMAFIGVEMIDLFKLATVTVSRSGAGTVCELIAVGKKSIFVPLKIAQKNEQFYNAVEAKNKLGSMVIEEKDLNDESFLNALNEIGFHNPSQRVVDKNGLNILLEEIKLAFVVGNKS